MQPIVKKSHSQLGKTITYTYTSQNQKERREREGEKNTTSEFLYKFSFGFCPANSNFIVIKALKSFEREKNSPQRKHCKLPYHIGQRSETKPANEHTKNNHGLFDEEREREERRRKKGNCAVGKTQTHTHTNAEKNANI